MALEARAGTFSLADDELRAGETVQTLTHLGTLESVVISDGEELRCCFLGPCAR